MEKEMLLFTGSLIKQGERERLHDQKSGQSGFDNPARL
jgi:hypothetical protein